MTQPRTVQGVGPYQDIVEAPSPGDPETAITLGLRSDTFKQYTHYGLKTAVAQYYGLVQSGLLAARHAFRGLKRPLNYAGDMEADKSVIVYSWRPAFDYEWDGTREYGNPISRNPPSNLVFVVLVREEPPNEHNVFGSIEKWNWVGEDPQLRHAPVDWAKRYGNKLWSRGI